MSIAYIAAARDPSLILVDALSQDLKIPKGAQD